MNKYQIQITEQDLDEYFFTLSNRGIIRQTRFEIIRSMPKNLKSEFQTKFNDLVCCDKQKRIYKIIVKKGSKRLQRYLNQYIYKLNP